MLIIQTNLSVLPAHAGVILHRVSLALIQLSFTRTRRGALINKIAESHMKKVYILIFTFIINYYLWIRNGR